MATERDDDVSRRYRSIPREEPPPAPAPGGAKPKVAAPVRKESKRAVEMPSSSATVPARTPPPPDALRGSIQATEPVPAPAQASHQNLQAAPPASPPPPAPAAAARAGAASDAAA